MDDRYRVFVAIEPGTEMEEFMDHMCNTEHVLDYAYSYGDQFGIFKIKDMLLYALYAKDRAEAGMIARCIRVTSKLNLKKGKLYRTSVGGPGTELEDFAKHFGANP